MGVLSKKEQNELDEREKVQAGCNLNHPGIVEGFLSNTTRKVRSYFDLDARTRICTIVAASMIIACFIAGINQGVRCNRTTISPLEYGCNVTGNKPLRCNLVYSPNYTLPFGSRTLSDTDAMKSFGLAAVLAIASATNEYVFYFTLIPVILSLTVATWNVFIPLIAEFISTILYLCLIIGTGTGWLVYAMIESMKLFFFHSGHAIYYLFAFMLDFFSLEYMNLAFFHLGSSLYYALTFFISSLVFPIMYGLYLSAMKKLNKD